MSVLIVGSVAYDGIETPFGRKEKTLGGSATYISLASSYFVRPVGIVGVVGHDFMESDLELLQQHEIDLEGLQIDKSGKTFYWAGRYHYDLNNRDTLDTQLNVFEHFNPEIPVSYRDSRYVCLGNIEPKLQMRVLDQVSKPDLVICDTMNFWIEGSRDDLIAILKKIDVLIINDSEARELADEPNLIKAALDIREMGPKNLIIKKGEHGAMLFSEEGIFSAPAYPLIDIFDPTGAGDTFLGGFVGWLAQTNDLSETNMRRAVIYGSVMASYCVEKFGAEQLTLLNQESIESRYREFERISRIPN